MINKNFETGKFHSALNIGVIQQLFKTGNKSEDSNYRPITII